ncbi:Homocysteine S-methyltransferase [Thalassoglobus neptunius]|uniref:Homocysteine S-methyltransferase n=1 Tax=Thalassoglobus neptunius TaxID=1938619 RepID=A0A5C5X227_9PLAN|nr:homocysteine S-methyltransferase family protein [Thalassoglobus neptunius]TWT57184.1 Homocysteine S-methyltransferase [Thalassoglobus neptunius]
MQSFLERYSDGAPILLDGATGTELERRGFELAAPGWSAAAIRNAPERLTEIHRDYVAAGAEILTANTFRTHARNLEATQWRGMARELTEEAVGLAREASQGRAYVAGSIAPLGDCYSPDETPVREDLERHHAEMIEHLCDANVDLILVETQLTIQESEIIARRVAQSGCPFFVSFVCNASGNLLSGEPLSEALKRVLEWNPLGCLLNCVPVDEVAQIVSSLPSELEEGIQGAYANTGRMISPGVWESTPGVDPAVYAEFVTEWRMYNFRLIGGCCGTTPSHVSALKEVL